VKKINVFVKMQPFPEVWLFLLSLASFWSEFGYNFFFLSGDPVKRCSISCFVTAGMWPWSGYRCQAKFLTYFSLSVILHLRMKK